MHKCSLFSTGSSTVVVSCLTDNTHPFRSEMIYHCGFDLRSPHDYYVKHLSICMAICMSTAFYWNVYPSPLFTFKSDWFLLVCCVTFLYILDINYLSEKWFAVIFSHSVGCQLLIWPLYNNLHHRCLKNVSWFKKCNSTYFSKIFRKWLIVHACYFLCFPW